MMTMMLRVVLIVVSVITMTFMMRKIRQAKVQIEAAMFWVIMALILVVFAVVPGAADLCARLLGIYSTPNFLFLFMIFLLIVKAFGMTIQLSQLESKQRELIQKMALEQKFLEEKEAELKEREDLRVDYMPQNYEDQLDLSMTPVDFLDSTGEKSERTKIRTYLGSLKYTADEMDHPIRELSGGQKAKVLLLKMSLGNANVLILDEPTRNFSPLSGPVIRKMLREFPGAIISISHDRKYIGEVHL